MPLTLHGSPPSPTQTVSVPFPNTMNIIPNSRLAVSTSSATRSDDATRGARECHSKVPVVKLDVDTISDMTTSSLASSLLAHVLFLKNQIPLPVMQLAKLSNAKRNKNATDTRATKHRTELLATYDTLASHLSTTFTSLSTAFARCKRLDASSQASYQHTAPSEQDDSNEDGANVNRRKNVRVYVAILVGPSIGSARTKVLLGVDGLEARIWGEREDVPSADADETGVDDSEGDEESEDEGSEEEDSEESEDNEESAQQEDGESVTGEEDELKPLELSDEDGDEATPPPSSPSLSSNSLSSSPSSSPKLLPTSISPLKSPPTKPTSTPYISHAQQQQTLLNAERLLSRALALADADGYSLASDMTPTQTHILIRAPRRFSHPAWIPRQNVTSSMEKVLEEFLEESGITPSSTLPADRSCQNKGNSRKAGQKNMKKVEGIWVVGRRSRIGKDDADGTDNEIRAEAEGKEPDDERNENDDIIWWSWDGKLVGFSDW